MRRLDPPRPRVRIVVALVALLLLTACAAGPGSRWAPPTSEPAGFFVGLWHGLLLLVALIVSFFTDDVRIYEVHNTGLAYDIGFVLGVLAMSGSGLRVTTRRTKKKAPPPRREPDWDELGREFEAKVRARVSRWVDEEDWAEVGEKIERKVKEGLRRWLDEEDAGGGRTSGTGGAEAP